MNQKVSVGSAGDSSSAITTLLDVMADHVRHQHDQSDLYCFDPSVKDYVRVSYARLTRQAYAFGEQLLEAGAEAQSVCMIACHSPYATLVSFYGAISAGVIPMIFPMPKALGSHEALSERIKHWGSRFSLASTVVIERGLTEKFHESIPESVRVIRVADSVGNGASNTDTDESSASDDWPERDTPVINTLPTADDIAFFQTTSSSTGDHKAVVISHGNILANVSGIKAAVNMDENERMISWLPLFHDMGLVGTVLFSFCNRYPLYLMTPVQFVKRPSLWLKGMTEHRCTIATAPNFGYDYCSKRIPEKDLPELDLSSVKHLFIGAEPIRVSTIQSFVDRFRDAGIDESNIRPAYGLAESTIITSISLPENKAKFVCFNPDDMGIGKALTDTRQIPFDAESLADYVPASDIAICTAGKPIDGMTAEIVDENDQVVAGEGIAGEIVLKGHSVAIGYVGDKGELVARFKDGRMHTGDMGIIKDDELYIIERIKNIVIRNGENYLVSAIEEQIADLLGISHEQVAVFETDILDPESDIVVLVERQGPIDDDAVNHLLANFPQESYLVNRILLSKSREIPRTTSGKKRHFYCRNLYQKNALAFQQDIEISSEKINAAKKALAV